MADSPLETAIAAACGGTHVSAPQVAKLDSAGIASITGEPDFVVIGASACVLGESKVAAHESSHRYTFQQFTKYQMLGAMIACARDPAIRKDTVHLDLVPDSDPNRFCSDYDSWQPEVLGTRLDVRAPKLRLNDPKNRFRIAVRSEPGVGSTFAVTMPAARSELAGEAARAV